VLGAGQVLVSEIGCQPRKESLQIRAASVPIDQPVNSSGVPQIVKPRLAAGSAFAPYRDHQTQTTEGTLDDLVSCSAAIAKAEDGTIGAGWVPLVTVSPVGPQDVRQIPTEWNEAGFIELALPNREKGVLEVQIGDVQRECFPESQSGSVQQQDQCT